MKEDNVALLNALAKGGFAGVQRILDKMKQDGALREISVKWFGSDITTLK